MMKRFLSGTLFVLLAAVGLMAAPAHHVTWTTTIDSVSPTQGVIRWSADIQPGYHIYGMDMPAEISGMPTNPTKFTINPFPGLELGEVEASVPVRMHADADLGAEIPWYDQPVTFSQPFTLAAGIDGVAIKGVVNYMVCDESSCTPPAKETFDLRFGAPVVVDDHDASETAAVTDDYDDNAWWAPVAMVNTQKEDSSLLGLFIIAFLGGLLALLTPCVWPMIPMTVSFFLKTNKKRSQGIKYAMLYSLSIVVIFIMLGLIFTAILGPEALNDLATSAVFNVAFFILLVVFAISFMGAFEIKLPSRWSNAMDSKAESTTGLISIFFMAFTLVLVSFSCTSPIVGTLLVEAVADGGSIISPLVGMTGFALGLALPFGLFAMFPSFLQSMPKSGGWLNSVKVVLGFIELILSLKFLSVADLAYGWRLLDREIFIAIWIVLFVLLGMYLLGKLRFSHDSESKHTSLLGFFLAVASFSFAVYLVPGLWGAPLKGISAFAPPISTQDFNLYGGEYEVYDDYDEGMARAKAEGKPVFVDFTGYGCVNCRKMEMAVFDQDQVRNLIEDNYVMIRLYVDEKAPLPAPYTVTEDDETVTITTYGEKWSYLQMHKFGILAQPYYVLLDNEGRPLEGPRMYDEDVAAFVKWLEDGVANYKK